MVLSIFNRNLFVLAKFWRDLIVVFPSWCIYHFFFGLWCWGILWWRLWCCVYIRSLWYPGTRRCLYSSFICLVLLGVVIQLLPWVDTIILLIGLVFCVVCGGTAFAWILFFVSVARLSNLIFLTHSICVFHIATVYTSSNWILLLLSRKDELFFRWSLVVYQLGKRLIRGTKFWYWWSIVDIDDHSDVAYGMCLVFYLIILRSLSTLRGVLFGIRLSVMWLWDRLKMCLDLAIVIVSYF